MLERDSLKRILFEVVLDSSGNSIDNLISRPLNAAFFIMKYINIILILVLLAGCKSDNVESKLEKVDPPQFLSKWKAVVKEEFVKSSHLTNFPDYIYIFPPIRIDMKGNPRESFDVQTGLDGLQYCLTTNLFAAQLQKKLSDLILQKELSKVISYDQFLKTCHQDNVASLSSYYSDPVYPISDVNNSSSMVEMAYFSTDLFLLDSSMNLENRKILASQKLFIRYHSDIEWKSAVLKVIPYLGSKLGLEQKHIKEIYWSDLEMNNE